MGGGGDNARTQIASGGAARCSPWLGQTMHGHNEPDQQTLDLLLDKRRRFTEGI
jgi:hypothetical protein